MSEQNTTEEPSTPKTVVAIDRANTIVVSPALRPIYPVRYAYANFIGDNISAPAEPPPLAELLNKSETSQTNGYMARILRPGWVYIREEQGGDHFHIFQYLQIEENGKLEERFPKFQFSNGINAQDGLKQDGSGSQKGGYPFAFVRKHVTEISIAYSEHEWHPDVIDKMNGNETERAAAMQRVSLIEDDQATVEATSDNLKELVEDYRTKQNRILSIKESDTDPSVKDLSLDILTTSASYDIGAEQLAVQLRARAKNLQQGKTARVIALHDPVGRQRDIAEVHAKLALWEKNYASSNIYPFTIGQIVNQLRQTEDEDLKEIIEESINWQEHDEYWKTMDTDVQLFQKRQQQFADLYRAFMDEDALTGKVGSLDTYFKQFFCYEIKSGEDADKELGKLCEVSGNIFDGITASEPGKAVMEDIISSESDKNVFYVATKGIRTLVTIPQASFEWSRATLRGIDYFFRGIGALLGEIVSWAKYGADLGKRAGNRLTFNGLSYVAEKLIPDLMKAFGLTVDVNKTVKLTTEELGKVMSKVIDDSVKRYPSQSSSDPAALKWAMAKMKKAQSLFNWSQRIKETELPQLWTLYDVKVTRIAGARYNELDLDNRFQVTAAGIDGTLGGISGFFNAMTIGELLNQTRFSQENPIRKGGRISVAMQYTAALSSLTVDTLSAARGATSVGAKALGRSSAQLAKVLAPQLKNKAQFLSQILEGVIAKRLIAIANFAAVIDAIIGGFQAHNEGNNLAVAGHSLVGLGSGILFLQAMTVIAGGSVTGPFAIAFAVVALLMVVAGVIMLIFSSKSDFQHLLENCFWGSGEKYLFWSEKNIRPSISRRLSTAQDLANDELISQAYQTETQEFMNYLNMPQLTMEDDHSLLSFDASRTYDLEFTLPNFQQGISDIHYSVRTIETIPANTRMGFTTEYRHNSQLTADFQAAANQARFGHNQGATTVHIRFKADEKIQLHWYYQPQPNTIAPMRHITEGGLQTKPIIGMINEEVAQ